jgi:hypothetical protein
VSVFDTSFLEQNWAEIRASGSGDGVLEVPSRATEISTGYGKVRVAIGAGGEPRLLVPVGRPAAGLTIVGSQNLLLARSSFRSAGKLEHFIDITLRNPKLSGVFAELTKEILKRLQGGNPPEPSVHGAIEDFRDLLARPSLREVPLTKLAGLAGELIVLSKLTAVRPTAVDSWTGPFDKRHDFRRREIAFEVKTSLRSDATRVTIHGPEQLLSPSNGCLYLLHVRLEVVDGGALSIGSLHQAVVGHGADRHALDQRLEELDCFAADAEEWNNVRFTLEGVDVYAVERGFPSITPRSFRNSVLPSGVVTLNYEIDLSTCRGHLLDSEQATALMAEFAS